MADTHSLDLELSSSQYAKITDAAQTGLDITGDLSFEAWIKLEQLPSTATSDFMLGAKTDGSTFSYQLYIQAGDNKMLFYYSNNGSTDVANTTYGTCDTAFDAGNVGVWTHVAVVLDASEASITFYINNVAKTTTYARQNATSIYNSAVDFSIGSRAGGGSYFDGKMDEVRVWNDIRTSGEISDNYQRELVGNEAGLVGYWKLNNDYLDETANNNDLTGVNSPVFSADVPASITTTSTSTTSSTSTTTTSTSSSTSSSTTTTSTSSSTSTSTTTTSTSSSTSSSTSTTLSSTTSTSTTTTSTSTSTTTTSTSSSTSSSTSTTTTSTSSSTSTTTSTSTSITTTSTSTTTTSTSSSTSTTTTLPFVTGSLVFGEENPTEGETAVSWQTFSDGAGGTPTIIGDAEWGKLEVDITEQGRSGVYNFGNANPRNYTVTRNYYGTGQGTATLQIRGSADAFDQDDELPEWNTYIATTGQSWRYIQIREIKES